MMALLLSLLWFTDGRFPQRLSPVPNVCSGEPPGQFLSDGGDASLTKTQLLFGGAEEAGLGRHVNDRCGATLSADCNEVQSMSTSLE